MAADLKVDRWKLVTMNSVFQKCVDADIAFIIRNVSGVIIVISCTVIKYYQFLFRE
jgi:hypothetical protein